MTESSQCYKKAVTEGVKGILKAEFYYDRRFFTAKHTKSALKIYNKKRLHVSLGYQIPSHVFEDIASINN